jgi:hypothetical protein
MIDQHTAASTAHTANGVPPQENQAAEDELRPFPYCQCLGLSESFI